MFFEVPLHGDLTVDEDDNIVAHINKIFNDKNNNSDSETTQDNEHASTPSEETRPVVCPKTMSQLDAAVEFKYQRLLLHPKNKQKIQSFLSAACDNAKLRLRVTHVYLLEQMHEMLNDTFGCYDDVTTTMCKFVTGNLHVIVIS
jgi:hypothetical protein